MTVIFDTIFKSQLRFAVTDILKLSFHRCAHFQRDKTNIVYLIKMRHYYHIPINLILFVISSTYFHFIKGLNQGHTTV